jgi:drug/metabolite transporter (DMT)-like permease
MEYIGELSALGAAVLWSFSSVLFTSVAQKIGSVQLSFWRLIFAVILLGITLYAASIPLDLTRNQIIFLSLSGIIGLVIGDTFLFGAFKEIGPRLSMLLMSVNPAMAAVIAYFFLDEHLSFIAIIGMALTLAGILYRYRN